MVCDLIKSSSNSQLFDQNVCDRIQTDEFNDPYSAHASESKQCISTDSVFSDGVLVADFLIDSTSDDDLVSLLIFEVGHEELPVHRVDVGPSKTWSYNGPYTIKILINGTGPPRSVSAI